MVMHEVNRTRHKLKVVQFIAEVSLIANCKPADLQLALSLIADLADSENENVKEIFYEAD